MGPDDAIAVAAQLMSAFASRTGLHPASKNQQRYLWTDAFAVCNFLELFERTGDELYRRCATDLIDQVHQVLGHYRLDDVRQGWISGLDEQLGQRHPTKAVCGSASRSRSASLMNQLTSDSNGTGTVSTSTT